MKEGDPRDQQILINWVKCTVPPCVPKKTWGTLTLRTLNSSPAYCGRRNNLGVVVVYLINSSEAHFWHLLCTLPQMNLEVSTHLAVLEIGSARIVSIIFLRHSSLSLHSYYRFLLANMLPYLNAASIFWSPLCYCNSSKSIIFFNFFLFTGYPSHWYQPNYTNWTHRSKLSVCWRWGL